MSQELLSVIDRLFAEGHTFDFFQAVRLLSLWQPDRLVVGDTGDPADEAVRFRARLSLNFPPSAIHEVLAAIPLPLAFPRSDGEEGRGRGASPRMTVTFMGLTGPSGVLPAHYTEGLLRLERDVRGDERYALRDWLDLFNHRLISLFYRAWEKYRLFPAYERRMRRTAPAQEPGGREHAVEDDPLTRVLFSLLGLGTPALRGRLRLEQRSGGEQAARVLAHIDDLALLYYGGLLAQRPRTSLGLETLIRDYFELPVRILQFQGQWLRLDHASQSRLGGGNNVMGNNLVVGERVWDVQSKIRLRLGPLRLGQFMEFLPNCVLPPEGESLHRRFGTFFLLVHLVRLFLGPELDFDIQLVLVAGDVPNSRLSGECTPGSRLGWDSWLLSQPAARDADDAVFEGEEVFVLP